MAHSEIKICSYKVGICKWDSLRSRVKAQFLQQGEKTRLLADPEILITTEMIIKGKGIVATRDLILKERKKWK